MMKRLQFTITLALVLAIATFGLLPTPAFAACSNPTFGYCVRDEFATQAYDRNDGSSGQTWNGSWTETGDDGTASAGAILVDNTAWALYLRGVTGNTDETGRYIQRAKTIPAGYTSATVEFSFDKGGSTATNELVDIMISTNGGTSFTTVQYNGGTAAGTKTFSLGDVAGSTVVIRFRIASDLKPATNDYFSFDNVEIRYSTPLAVTLAAFTAAATPAGVTLAWETVSETDNAGFNVYRAANDAGAWVRLNPALIPSAAPGSSEGHAYTWTDATALPGLAYAYLLEDVALDGTLTRHAPVTAAAASQPNAVGLAAFGATAAAGPSLAGLAALALVALAGARRRGRR